MELRHLRYFVTLAQAKNFSRASERLHIAQPALSISIRNLEEELGAKLFERGPRMVSLTPAGRIALASAKNALAQVEEMGRLVGSATNGEAGVLRIAFVGGATYSILPRYLQEFRRRYPGVQLELTESSTLEIIEDVRNGIIDAGIVRYPITNFSGLEIKILEKGPLIAVLPRGHRLAAKAKLRMRDFADEDLIQYSHLRSPSMNTIVSLACQRAGFVPKISQEALQIQTILSLVESGLGVALVPSSCQTASGQAVEFRPISDCKEILMVGLAMISNPTVNQRLVDNFVHVLVGSE